MTNDFISEETEKNYYYNKNDETKSRSLFYVRLDFRADLSVCM